MTNLDPTAYDSFGRILASGGEQAYAMGLAKGYPTDRLNAIMLRRFGDDFTNSGDLLGAYAAQMLDAADKINTAYESGAGISAGEIPNNPFMSEDESGGALYKWSADVTFEGAKYPINVRGESYGYDPEQLFADAETLARGIGEQYPGKFGLTEGQELIPLEINILYFQGVING
jgi:hypothetical protein